TQDDSLAVEDAYLSKIAKDPEEGDSFGAASHGSRQNQQQENSQNLASANEQALPIAKTVRRRSKAHLAFVASQPCLVCKMAPCDAHHLKIAQPRSLGRKVSDEFTVPLCRKHHQELHRHGNEANWWANLQITP